MDEQPSIQNNNKNGSKQIIIFVGLTALLVGGVTYLSQQLICKKATSILEDNCQKQIAAIQSETACQQANNSHTVSTESIQDQESFTYTSNSGNYSIRLPSTYRIQDYSLWNGSELLHQIKFYQNENNYFIIRVNLEEESQEAPYYLDELPVGQVKMGDLTAQKYIFDYKIQEGPDSMPLMVVASVYKKGKRYSIEFHNTKEIDQEKQKILSSFQLLDTD